MTTGWPCVTKAAVGAAVLAALLAGCSRRPGPETASPTGVQTETLQVGDEALLGMKLLMANGRPWAFLIRAGKGIVACPHIDIVSLGKAGVPAATAQNWNHGPWKDHGFVGQLGEKVLEVNAPATALGVKTGMTVEDALRLMSDRKESGQ